MKESDEERNSRMRVLQCQIWVCVPGPRMRGDGWAQAMHLSAAEAPDTRVRSSAALDDGAGAGWLRLAFWDSERHPAHFESLHVHNLFRLHLNTVEAELLWKRNVGLHSNNDRDGYNRCCLVYWNHLRLGTSKAVDAGFLGTFTR